MTKYNKFPSPKKKIIKNIKIFEQPVLKKKISKHDLSNFSFCKLLPKTNSKIHEKYVI